LRGTTMKWGTLTHLLSMWQKLDKNYKHNTVHKYSQKEHFGALFVTYS
jgi:hypothetical protein